MDIQAIMQELDSLYASGQRDRIEEFMKATQKEAVGTGDWSARIMIQNEMIGFYRTNGDFNRAYQVFTETLNNFRQLGLVGTLPYTGTLLNGATMLRAAGYPDQALELFEEVRDIYERELATDDYRLASLYNNLGLVYMDQKNYPAAEKYLLQAETIIEKLPDSAIEQATTLTTLANISMSSPHAIENAFEYLKKAESLFVSVNNQDPHYASYLSALAQYQILTRDLEGAIHTFQTGLEVIEHYHGRNRNYQIVQQNLDYLKKKLDI